MVRMIEGKCPKCGDHAIGWSLLLPRYQTCHKCGSGYVITDGGKPIGKGYSPFTAPAESDVSSKRTNIKASN